MTTDCETKEAMRPKETESKSLQERSGKTHHHDTWQKNNRLGWTFMSIYWALGALVGTDMGYLPFPESNLLISNQQQIERLWYLAALTITLGCQPALLMRFGSFGRKRSWTAVVIFALFNGTFETVLFLAAYDAGRRFASDFLGWNVPLSITFGFCIYNVYAALIHTKFWLPLALPRHTLPDAPPFHTTMLPALIVMSVAWIALYERTGRGDVATICLFHGMYNTLGTAKMCLASPFQLPDWTKRHRGVDIDRDTVIRMAQEAIKSNNKRLVDAVVRMQVEHASVVKSGDERVENLPLIGVTCSTGWECYAIVQELCATRRFRVRAMYRTPGTHAEKRLKKLLQETSVPGLLTLRPHTDLNSAQILTEAFADCHGVVLYVTANTSVAGKVNNHGNDPVGGRAVVMRQILAIDSALRANPSIKQVVTLAFPTDKVRGILPDAPEAPWWIQQRNIISDFLRGQGHNVTCIRRPGYYYAMHRVDYTNVASFRGETRMSKVMIRENYMPGIMAPDFVVNWVDVRDVGKWVGTCFQYPQVFSNENLSIASCVMTGRERAAMAEKVNKHGTKFSYRRFPPLLMRLLALFSDEVVYPLRISQWYNEHANAYDFASEEDLADLDRVHPRWTFEEKLISWGIDEIVPVKQGL